MNDMTQPVATGETGPGTQQQRRKFIGGSDVAAIMGVSPWKSAVEVWQDKTGRRTDDRADDPAIAASGDKLKLTRFLQLLHHRPVDALHELQPVADRGAGLAPCWRSIRQERRERLFLYAERVRHEVVAAV